MRTSTLQGVLGRLRRLGGGELAPSDAELLACFGSGRVEAAFTLLLERHGAMVLGVCRRVLRDTHEAEDAFQATFLALAQGAGSVRKQGRRAMTRSCIWSAESMSARSERLECSRSSPRRIGSGAATFGRLETL